MTAKRFQISPATASFCEAHGLFHEDEMDYTDDEIRRLGLIHTLLEAGFPDNTLTRYLKLLDAGAQGCLERKSLLHRQRMALLDEIHEKEQTLHQLDYLIRELEHHA